MKKLKVYLLACILGAMAASCTDHSIEDPFTETDRTFVKTILDYTKFMFSTSAGAANKSKDSVYNFSTDIVAYITPAQLEAVSIASTHNIPFPDSLPPVLEARYAGIRSLPGGLGYDTTYVNGMVVSLQEMLTLCREERDRGNDPATKAFAQNQIVYLKDFLGRALVLDSLQRL